MVLNLTVHNRAELLHQLADNVTDVAIMLNWYIVHRAKKRLPSVASAFKHFLTEGAALIEGITHFSAQNGRRTDRGPSLRKRKKGA